MWIVCTFSLFPFFSTNYTANYTNTTNKQENAPINNTITTITQAHKYNKQQQLKEGLGGIQIPHFLPATDFDYFEQIIKKRTRTITTDYYAIITTRYT
jgi:hypothetical protein